ncbi:tetratricopeptide repeat protein, partial [Nitrospiraceae bacterium AH_259_D15_M11_P09]|nr:tetratricopeptide repeat protein [Nitrospiraceae bacterium AH_259_D15_M11_P09]
MGIRRVLVIGSQCPPLGTLSFLPQLAQELYDVMADPELGSCQPATGERGLLLDPTVHELKAKVEAAFQEASQKEDTLILAFIGHGDFAGEDFYLLPADLQLTNETVVPTSETALHLIQKIKQLHRRYSSVDGLVVLADTCGSGVAPHAAAATWVKDLTSPLRFEMLMATADRQAADGCFTKTLVDVIRNGIESMSGETLRCEAVRKVIEECCPNQQPQQPTYNADEGLWLAKNAARRRHPTPWRTHPNVERLTRWLVPTAMLSELVEKSKTARCVIVEGLTGQGKSALAAALARPEITEGLVPDGFVHALVFISASTSSEELARQLAEQLDLGLPQFGQERAAFKHCAKEAELAKLNSLRQEVLMPLQRLFAKSTPGVIRLVLDGFDQLMPTAARTVVSALNELANHPDFHSVRLIITTRPDTAIPVASEHLVLGQADASSLQAYLDRRSVSPSLRKQILNTAKGNWLIVHLLADVAADPAFDPKRPPKSLTDIYGLELRRQGGMEPARWRTQLRPILSVLAAAGAGPVLPLRLLCAASGKLGGPHRPKGVRDVLVDCRGLVVRNRPGTQEELAGVFHQTFAGYLLNPSTGEFGIDRREPHRAIVDALTELAPMETHQPDDLLHRYAAAAEVSHLWEIGEHSKAVQSLVRREGVVPAENLARWEVWYRRILKTLGPDHPDTLTTRSNLAFWTGRTGKVREALRLFTQLLPDQQRVLGPEHPDTLTTRGNLAFWTGRTGDAREAFRFFTQLLPDQQRVLGHDHPDTLTTRSSIASWTGRTADAQKALHLFTQLLPDQHRVLGPEHPDTLTTRSSIA